MKYIFITIIFISILFSSCLNKNKISNQQKRLVNEVLTPIFFTHLIFQYNVQFHGKRKAKKVTSYTKIEPSKRYYDSTEFAFNSEGKIDSEYSFYFLDDYKKKLKTKFEYDSKSRISKIKKIETNEVFIFTYNNHGLVSEIHNKNKQLLYKFRYLISSDISEINITNNKYTHKYEFIDISSDKQTYNLKYYPSGGGSKEMTYSFNKNGTMSEVYGRIFDKNGVPMIKQKNKKYKIYSKIDIEGNWVEQKVESTLHVRNITYQ